MIYVSPRGSLSRRMSGYVVADTGNPTGWRPQYKTLGSPLPDWKTVASARDRQMALQSASAAAQQKQARRAAVIDDARVRGVRPFLGDLGLLDNNSQMTKGAQYVFYFNPSGNGLQPSAPGLQRQIASDDSNFGTPVVQFLQNGQLAVSFVYQGQGSIIYNAGQELANVMNTSVIDKTLYFAGADGGAAPSAPQVTAVPAGPLYTDPSTGITYNPDGSVQSSGNQNQQPSFWTSIFSAGAGNAVASAASGLSSTVTLGLMGIFALMLIKD